MLTRLLALIAEGNLHTAGDLAAALGVNRELVEAMLAELQRQGYLAKPPSTCAGACAACPLGAACGRVETTSGGVSLLLRRGAERLGRSGPAKG